LAKNKFAPNAIFRVVSVYIYYLTSHVKFYWKIPPIALVIWHTAASRCLLTKTSVFAQFCNFQTRCLWGIKITGSVHIWLEDVCKVLRHDYTVNGLLRLPWCGAHRLTIC
jgi:hypothetical protein